MATFVIAAALSLLAGCADLPAGISQPFAGYGSPAPDTVGPASDRQFEYPYNATSAAQPIGAV